MFTKSSLSKPQQPSRYELEPLECACRRHGASLGQIPLQKQLPQMMAVGIVEPLYVLIRGTLSVKRIGPTWRAK